MSDPTDGFVDGHAPNKQNYITFLLEKVKSLYNFRDCYFETHSPDEAKKKNIDVECEFKKTLRFFEDVNVAEDIQQGDRAMYYYLKGRVYNVMPEYSPQAEEALSKSVKLDPKLVDGWNDLGECYWKKNAVEEAKNCFSGALAHKRNKVSLRKMSMILRQQLSTSKADQVSNVEKGLALAKEAVQLDPSDGNSWCVLGNAYLSSFFRVAQNPTSLRLCMSAYLQAEKDAAARSNPDLYYNKAVALKYSEEYEKALACFAKAQQLDPTWNVPRQKELQLLKYLSDIQDLVTLKGKLKGKRLHQMLQALDVKHLGVYQGGSYTSPKGQSIKLVPVALSTLQTGVNLEKVVLGKVVCSVQNEDCVPFTFCLLDKEETCMAVTLYNVAQGKGVIIGDSVAIPEPFVSRVHVTHKQEFNFTSIRVDSPVVLVVNGKKLGQEYLASVQLSTFHKND